MKFSYLVTKYRERISLNKSEFAKKTGLKPGYITNIEKGKEYPSIERVEKMTTIFDLESNEASNFFRVYFSEKYPSFNVLVKNAISISSGDINKLLPTFLDSSQIKSYAAKGKLDWGSTEATPKYGDVLKVDHLSLLDRLLGKLVDRIAKGEISEEDAQKRIELAFKLFEQSWRQAEEILGG